MGIRWCGEVKFDVRVMDGWMEMRDEVI